jgi:ABC-type transport system substrate-binding protein
LEEPVLTDERGHMAGAVMEDSSCINDRTLEVKVRRGIRFHDGEECTVHSVNRAFEEMQRWKAPHPPGSDLNIHPETVAEILDDYKLRLYFPGPDGRPSWAGCAGCTS